MEIALQVLCNVIERLRQDGHDVLAVVEMEPSISDEQVLERANQMSALLLTSDKDFGELVFRLRRLAAGVILLRLAGEVQNVSQARFQFCSFNFAF